jgi:hypothetical protein
MQVCRAVASHAMAYRSLNERSSGRIADVAVYGVVDTMHNLSAGCTEACNV